MLRLAPSGRFKRDIKRGKDLQKLPAVLELLLVVIAGHAVGPY